ncbi:MAG: DUF1761 domain-containing protein [Candidatus Puniceispirillaceae bacterium]
MIALILFHYPAILVSAVLAFLSGMIWYHPHIFGSLWAAEQPHRTMPDDFQKDMKKGMVASLLDAVFFSIMALLLLAAYQLSGIIILAISVVIGIYTNTVFKGGTNKLFFIDGGFLLCQLAIITIVMMVMTG